MSVCTAVESLKHRVCYRTGWVLIFFQRLTHDSLFQAASAGVCARIKHIQTQHFAVYFLLLVQKEISNNRVPVELVTNRMRRPVLIIQTVQTTIFKVNSSIVYEISYLRLLFSETLLVQNNNSALCISGS